jgi:hypothetical protein
VKQKILKNKNEKQPMKKFKFKIESTQNTTEKEYFETQDFLPEENLTKRVNSITIEHVTMTQIQEDLSQEILFELLMI